MKRYLLSLAILAGAPCAFAQTAAPQSPRDYQEDFYVTPYWTRTPMIEAIGRAELEVAPNRAAFTVTYLETEKDSKDAMTRAVERARLAYDTIKKTAGETARVQSSVSVQPYFEQYRDGDGNVTENTRADKIKGYQARASMSVTVEDVALAGKARAAALALGPEDSSPLNIYLQQTAEMTRAAYEAAVADGAARAKATASASGTTLGRLMTAQEGGGPCLGRWSTVNGRVPGDGYYPAPAPAPMAAMERSQDTVTVSGQMVGGKMVTITQGDIDQLNLPSDTIKQTVSSSVCLIYAAGN
jgi:uncharacterized protein